MCPHNVGLIQTPSRPDPDKFLNGQNFARIRLSFIQDPKNRESLLTGTGAHNLERETSTRSCLDVFTDQFIFRTVLARNIFSISQTSQQNLQT